MDVRRGFITECAWPCRLSAVRRLRRLRDLCHSPVMIYEIFHNVCRRIREHADLSRKIVAKAMGLQSQAIWRWETKDQNPLPSREQEAILVELAKLSQLAFVQIMCDELSEFLGRAVIIAPEGQFLPGPPLSRARKEYAASQQEIDPELQQTIEGKLYLARSLEALVEQAVHQIAQEVEQLVEEHRARSRGRSA